MARRLTPRRVYEDLMRRHETALAEAFMAAVNDLRANADLQRLTAALEVGDVERALAALNLDPAAYAGLREAMRAGYVAGGTATAATVQSAGAVFRFDVGNPRAEAWLQDHSAQLITRIVADQREAVRSYLVGGMARGANPRTTALDMVGRINRAKGRREGGVLGLSTPQEQALRRAGRELLSGDPAQLRNYLTRARRDRRFDRTIEKAIREGQPVPAHTVSRATRAYSNRMIQLRGETIARTESMASLHAAQHEALQQAVDAGAVQANQVRRVWRSAADNRVRDTHRAMNGESVGLDEPWISPSGASLRYPGDPSAPVEEIVNCRCWAETRIDFLANLR